MSFCQSTVVVDTTRLTWAFYGIVDVFLSPKSTVLSSSINPSGVLQKDPVVLDNNKYDIKYLGHRYAFKDIYNALSVIYIYIFKENHISIRENA